MTESEWLNATDPLEMLRALGVPSDRKLRLFAAGCVRRVWHLLTDESSRYAVELSEQAADEPISDTDLDLASGGAEAAYMFAFTDDEGIAVADDDPGVLAAHAASYATNPVLEVEPHLDVVVRAAAGASILGSQAESAVQAALLRDVFGPNPFGPPCTVTSAWLAWNDGTTPMLAESAYELRSLPNGELEPDRLAVLADALEEARADALLMEHLRGLGSHVRGCFVVDLLTGRE